MRSTLMLMTLMTQLLAVNVGLAQTESYDDCRQNCVDEKEMRDMDCPSPYESMTPKQERDQCLKESRDTYNSCLKNCPAPSSAEPSAPPMGY